MLLPEALKRVWSGDAARVGAFATQQQEIEMGLR